MPAKLAKEVTEIESLSCMARQDPLKGFSLVLEPVIGQAGSHSFPFYSSDSVLVLLFMIKQSHACILAYSLKF